MLEREAPTSLGGESMSQSAYILGKVDQMKLNAGLEINKLNLQKLFVELTKKEGEV